MVDPYATTLGGHTLAVDSERFVMEEPDSNSVLSLTPAISLAGEKRPRRCEAILGFSTREDRIEIEWRAVGGIEVTSVLRLAPGESAERTGDEEKPARLSLAVRIANRGDAPVALGSLHPLYFPPEGPGACALALEDLRALGARRPEASPQLIRLRGENLWSAPYGAWFSPVGSPALMLAPLAGDAPWPRFAFAGARGKLLSLRVDSAAPEGELAPGAVFETPPLLLVIGNFDIREELFAWADGIGDARALEALPDFDPSGEIAECDEETEVEALQAETAQAAQTPQPDAEPEEPETPEDETPAEMEEPDAEPELDEAEPDTVAPELDEAEPERLSPKAASANPLWHIATDRRMTLAHRCATQRRAMRNTRAFQETGRAIWPRWAAARQYAPLSGCAARTRGYWRSECPGPDEA